jgi:hypothetical protein
MERLVIFNFEQYFSCIMDASFIDGGNPKKTIDLA